MKSSAISLRFQVELRSDDTNTRSVETAIEGKHQEESTKGNSKDEKYNLKSQTTEFLVNLIDSPGEFIIVENFSLILPSSFVTTMVSHHYSINTLRSLPLDCMAFSLTSDNTIRTRGLLQ